jgi:hypothetical protein
MRRITWFLAAAAVLVTVLGIVAIAVLLRGVDGSIPVVSDIHADLGSDARVEFSWNDPGLSLGDRYQITVTADGVPSTPALQESTRFVVDADPGDTVCLSVLVNRNGTLGATSAEKCVDATEG